METVSRHGTHWPRPDDDAPEEMPVRRALPDWVNTVMLILVILLTVTTALTLVYAVRVEGRLNQAEADRIALRAARDNQLAEMDQKFCDMLDNLPAGPVLDPVRKKFGCTGLGIPPEQLDPAARQQLKELANDDLVPLYVVPIQPQFDTSTPPPS
jgi:hypothetical protein